MFVQLVAGHSGFGRSRVSHKGRTKFNIFSYKVNKGRSFDGTFDAECVVDEAFIFAESLVY